MKEKKLTMKQKRFCQEFLVDLNAAAAARRAGYNRAGCRQAGHILMSNSYIREEIRKAIDARAGRTEIKGDMVVNELAKLGFANFLDYCQIQEDGTAYVDLSRLTREQAAAISEVHVDEYTDGKGDDARQVKRVRLKFHDKKAALELLGKHTGIFEKDNQQKTQTIRITSNV